MIGLKALRRRISSIKSTQQITRAMKMVASARLRRAHERMIEARPYADKIREVLQNLAMKANPQVHPLLARREMKRVELLIVTSNRGLCGSFNQNVSRRVEGFMRENQGTYDEISLSVVGRKGLDYFRRRRVPIIRNYVGAFRELDYGAAATMAKDVIADYTAETIDGLFLIYNEYHSPLVQRVQVKNLIPLDAVEIKSDYPPVDYLYEPSAEAILAALIPQYIEVQIYRALLESVTGELGARMTAMGAATDNAQEMIEKLSLVYNKARQTSITKEMMEIVGGVEALR
jgi:F-type H+-transporting ATPase subunit gamma